MPAFCSDFKWRIGFGVGVGEGQVLAAVGGRHRAVLG
jgi:hypothetical protein